MVQPKFFQAINTQDYSDRKLALTEDGHYGVDQVTLGQSDFPEWTLRRRSPQLVGMPAFAQVCDQQATMFHNGRIIRPVVFTASSDLGLA